MCESNIVKRDNDKEILIAEDIDFVKILPNNKLLIRTVLGKEAHIDGEIEEIDLHSHKVIIKST